MGAETRLLVPTFLRNVKNHYTLVYKVWYSEAVLWPVSASRVTGAGARAPRPRAQRACGSPRPASGPGDARWELGGCGRLGAGSWVRHTDTGHAMGCSQSYSTRAMHTGLVTYLPPLSGLSWRPSAVYLQRTDRNYSGSGAAAPPPHSQAARAPLPGRDRAAPDPAGVITRYYSPASDTYYFASTHYAARLPVDLSGEQHPS